MSARQILPHRREAITETITLGLGNYEASVGFDPHGDPQEIFLSGAKDGTDMAAILADTSVVVSIALQHRIRASVLARSISRVPRLPDEPATEPASVIGAALDLLCRYERTDIRDLVTHPSIIRDVLDDYAASLGVAGEIAAERKRQMVEENYSTTHDDSHDRAELAQAAAAFALWAAADSAILPHEVRRWSASVWPFEPSEFREKRSARRMLVIAGALLLAEIERLDRSQNGSCG